MEFATMYPPWFKSWNHFYSMILLEEAQDDEEYSWVMEPVRHEGVTRYYSIPNSPYHYRVRYVQQQALAELRANTFNYEQSNIIYKAVQQYGQGYRNTVFYSDRFAPLLDQLKKMADK